MFFGYYTNILYRIQRIIIQPFVNKRIGPNIRKNGGNPKSASAIISIANMWPIFIIFTFA